MTNGTKCQDSNWFRKPTIFVFSLRIAYEIVSNFFPWPDSSHLKVGFLPCLHFSPHFSISYDVSVSIAISNIHRSPLSSELLIRTIFKAARDRTLTRSDIISNGTINNFILSNGLYFLHFRGFIKHAEHAEMEYCAKDRGQADSKHIG